MNPIAASVVALGLLVGLAACSKKEAATPAQTGPLASTAAAGSTNMAGMPMSPGAKMAKGAGTVTAVDPAAGTITLDHGAIPEVNWPAMTMAFKAAPGVTHSVKAGDKVSFDLKVEGGTGEVTAVRRQ